MEWDKHKGLTTSARVGLSSTNNHINVESLHNSNGRTSSVRKGTWFPQACCNHSFAKLFQWSGFRFLGPKNLLSLSYQWSKPARMSEGLNWYLSMNCKYIQRSCSRQLSAVCNLHFQTQHSFLQGEFHPTAVVLVFWFWKYGRNREYANLFLGTPI